MKSLRQAVSSFNKKYWSTKTDAGHRHSSEEMFQNYAGELLALLPVGGTLLDVGCGSCQVTAYLTPHFKKIYGTDFSETMLIAARERLCARGTQNVELLYGTFQKFPPEITSADVILSYAVVQSVSLSEFARHLEEARRILKPGGVLCVGLVPDIARRNVYYYGFVVGNRYRRLRKLRSWAYLVRLRFGAHMHGNLLWDGVGNWFSQSEIEEVAREAGFTAEFRSAWFSDYRFHALLRIKANLPA